jgi:hypothetical protein
MIRALLPVQPLTMEVHETGLALAERCGPSTWDAMIAASALHADCDTSGPKVCRTGWCSMTGSTSSTRFLLRNVAT